MTGWEASSRPAWDPQGEAGENTQAFSAPDIPESTDDQWPGTDDQWPKPSAPPSGSDYSGRPFSSDDRQSSRLGSGSPAYDPGPAGPPPDIFQQDYGQQDYGQQDYGQQDYGQQDYARRDRDYAPRDYTPREYTSPGTARDYPSRDRDYLSRDYASDRPETDHASRDRAGLDYSGRHAGPDRAARMDPALQDFFAPRPSRADSAESPFPPRPTDSAESPFPPRPTARGASGQGTSTAAAPRGPVGGQPDGAPQPGQPLPPRQPSPSSQSNSPRSELGRLVQPGQPGRLDDSAQPGRRTTGAFSAAVSATGSWAVSRQGRRSLTVGAVLVVIALAIAGVEFLQGSRGNSSARTSSNTTSTATGAATTRATTNASPKASATHKPTVKKAGYLLTTPAIAGGYPLLATVPSYVQGPASSTAQTVRGPIVSNGGMVTGSVAAAYQLSGGQVLAFTGYKGTFTPAKVIASLGANAQTYPAGKDGGSLACFTASGSEPGTVCAWATTTTVGIAEFFSSVGPETVTIQSKAAADTVKLRDSIEHRQS